VHLSNSKKRQLENDLSACGCGAGSGASLIAFLGLILFARGDLNWQLVLFWFVVIAIATITGKVSWLIFTYLRAKRTLISLRQHTRSQGDMT